MEHQFREDGSHYNGGAEFFGYGYAAIGEPRLKMVRRWYRTGKRRGQTEDHFFVDGEPAPNYGDALARLKHPPGFSRDEISALRQIGDEPADHRASIGHDRLHYLNAKGAIAWGPPGRCALTDAGRAVLSRVLGEAATTSASGPGTSP